MPNTVFRPIGWEWIARYPERFPDPALTFDYARDGCPICGHPTGDCLGTEEAHLMAEAKAKQGPVENKAHKAADGANAALEAARESAQGVNQGGQVTAEAADEYARSLLPEEQTTVVVAAHVWGTYRQPGSDRDAEKLLYHKGQVITREEAQREDVPTVSG